LFSICIIVALLNKNINKKPFNYIFALNFTVIINNYLIMLKQIITLTIVLFMGMSCSNRQKNINGQQSEIADSLNWSLYLFIGTYTSSGSKGVYVYKFDVESGKTKYVSEVEVQNPSYMEISADEKFLYTVSENKDIEAAKLSSFSFDKKEGKLNLINDQLTEGAAPCYVCVDNTGRHIVNANYSGGSVTVFSANEDGTVNPAEKVFYFSGRGTDKDRQKQPHLHSVTFSPDEEYVYACDLGTDKIYKFKTNRDSAVYLNIGEPGFFKLPDGTGPRHMEFHPNGKHVYVIGELSGEVIAFDYIDGNLNELQRIKADTLSAKGSADIHISPDGKYLYASNRLKGDGLAIFSIDETNGTLTKVGYQPTGVHPRNFVITPDGNFLLVANRDSNNVQVFRRNKDTGLLIDTKQDIRLDKPVCLKFASIN